MKYVVGVAGDVIKVSHQKIWVAGIYRGHLQKYAYDGYALQPLHVLKIPPGYIFVWGTHPRSFDSRYQDVGLINEKSILGRGYRIF